jgi:acyl dehydratase
MRLMVQTRLRKAAARQAEGLPVAKLGPSPGFKGMRWILPVYAGDTVSFDSTLVDKRASASRPGWGLVTHHNTGTNQTGARVFEFTSTAFWQSRLGEVPS